MSTYFKFDKHEFRVGETIKNNKFISRVSRYDLQEYHWAYKADENDGIALWKIVLNGKIVSELMTNDLIEDENESVASYLLAMDEKANLHKIIDRT